MHHPVLEVSVGGANWSIHPRRDEYAERGGAVRIHVEEAEYLGLGEAHRVQHGAGLKLAAFRQLHNGLHAEAPVVGVMAGGEAELRVDGASNCADRPVGDDRERGFHVHAGHVRAIHGRAVLLHALVRKAHAGHLVAVEDRRGNGHPRHDHQARFHHLLRGPRHERSHLQNESGLLLHELRRERQFARVPLAALHEHAAHLEREVYQLRAGRALRAAEVVEEIRELLLLHLDGVWNLLREVDAWERRLYRLASRDDSGNAEARVVRALVAHHLKRTSRHRLRLVEGRAVLLRLRELRPDGCEKTCGGRTKSRHHDVCFHCLAFHSESSVQLNFMQVGRCPARACGRTLPPPRRNA